MKQLGWTSVGYSQNQQRCRKRDFSSKTSLSSPWGYCGNFLLERYTSGNMLIVVCHNITSERSAGHRNRVWDSLSFLPTVLLDQVGT
ncbi:uncharacterized protein J5F26_001767 isoform 2-T3 [Ciconia maguari]